MTQVINLFPYKMKPRKVMVFVDGENFAIRYGHLLGDNKAPSHVRYEPNVFLWSTSLNLRNHHTCDILRVNYYTSVQGDTNEIERVEDRLKELGIENPRVFKRNKTKGSKRVDISIATDMLGHAHRKNMDLAVLVAGDEDYVPLVNALKYEGCQVLLWFFANGLSKALLRAVDCFIDIQSVLTMDMSQLRISST